MCIRDSLTTWFQYNGTYFTTYKESGIRRLALAERLRKLQLSFFGKRDLACLLYTSYFITGHTGWTDNFAFAFAHKDKHCSPFKKRVHDPSAPYDAYDESDDTKEKAKSGFLKGVGR